MSSYKLKSDKARKRRNDAIAELVLLNNIRASKGIKTIIPAGPSIKRIEAAVQEARKY